MADTFQVSEEEVVEILQKKGAYRTRGHFRIRSKLHAGEYVHFDDMVTGVVPSETHILARALAERIAHLAIQSEVLVCPRGAAAVLAYAIARWMSPRPLACFVGEKKAGGAFEFDPISSGLIKDKQVLLLDDVVSTGGTFDQLEVAVRACGGELIGRAALWSWDPSLDVVTVVKRTLRMFEPGRATCPKCREGMPLDTTVGHGADEVA